uniref:Uncharacterized protein n=1 Tax=Rhizophora mucronata TaxID=61149 RepID=A0A2P2NBS7_RHIMU
MNRAFHFFPIVLEEKRVEEEGVGRV